MEPKGVFNSNPFDLKGEFTNGDVLLIEAPQIIAQPSGDRLSSGEQTNFQLLCPVANLYHISGLKMILPYPTPCPYPGLKHPNCV